MVFQILTCIEQVWFGSGFRRSLGVKHRIHIKIINLSFELRCEDELAVKATQKHDWSFQSSTKKK